MNRAVTALCAHSGNFSHLQLFVTPYTVAHWAPLSMGFSRQEFWSGLPCPPPGDLPNPGINLDFLHCRRFFTAKPLGKADNFLAHLERHIASFVSLSTWFPDLLAGKMSMCLRLLHFDLHTWTTGAGETLG